MFSRHEEEKRKRLADFLLTKYDEWASKQRGLRNRTMTKWAAALRVPLPTLSHYVNGTRNSTGEVVYQLAASPGPEVLEICELPPALPDDPAVLELVMLWLNPKTSDERREKAIEILKGDKLHGSRGSIHRVSE